MPRLGSSRPRTGPCFEDFVAGEALPRDSTRTVTQMRPMLFSVTPMNTGRPHIHPDFLALGSFASFCVRATQFWTTIAGRRPAPAITV
jgi:acyl dehydratase